VTSRIDAGLLRTLVEEKRDRRLAELACACEERTPGKTLQSQVICVNAFRGRIEWSFPSAIEVYRRGSRNVLEGPAAHRVGLTRVATEVIAAGEISDDDRHGKAGAPVTSLGLTAADEHATNRIARCR
jgi:hypothetical protein